MRKPKPSPSSPPEWFLERVLAAVCLFSAGCAIRGLLALLVAVLGFDPSLFRGCSDFSSRLERRLSIPHVKHPLPSTVLHQSGHYWQSSCFKLRGVQSIEPDPK